MLHTNVMIVTSLLLILSLNTEAFRPNSKFSITNFRGRNGLRTNVLSTSRLKANKNGNSPLNHWANLIPTQKQFLSSIATTMIFLSSMVTTLPVDAKEYPVFEEVWSMVQKNYFDSTYNGQDWNTIHDESLQKLETGKVSEQKQIKEVLKSLNDKYSRLLDKKTYESLWKFDAIGVGLLFQSDSNSGKLFISAPPLEGSSGAKAGVLEGDIVYEVNGQSAEKLTAIQLLDQLSNDPNDKLTLVIGDKSGDLSSKRTVILNRQLQEKSKNPVIYSVQTIKDKKGDVKKVGYISMREFNALSVPGMKDALNKLIKQDNVDLIALDLRGNPGGGFQFAMNIGGMFLENDKVMVTAAGRGLDQTAFKASYPEGVLSDRPLLLIMDGLSASSSEVLAAGLHDNCRASVIGATSFGKGKIQAVFGLKDGEGLALTVAQYVSPSGRVIQSNGIPPDLPVSVANPVVNSLFGSPSFTAVDLNGIDLDLAFENMQKSCAINFKADRQQSS